MSVVFASLALLLACSEKPGAGGGGSNGIPSGGTSGSSGSAGSSGSSGAIDGGSGGGSVLPGDTPGPLLCEGTTQFGSSVSEEAIVGPAPATLGGPLVPGIYVLQALQVHGAAVPPGSDPEEPPSSAGFTGATGRGTLYVTTKTLRFISARAPQGSSLGSDALTGFSYVASGNNLALTSACPQPGQTKTVGYSGVGAEITLQIDATHREVYRKK